MNLGQMVGSYRVTAQLGEGGMGAVYTAEHVQLGKRAAIKVLLPEYSAREDLVTRFFNEARAASRVNHPGIVEVYDYGHLDDGSAFILMQLLDGESLAGRLRRGPLAPADAIALMRQIAGALGAAHRAGIVHRDLKPDNVFLCPDPDVARGERAKLLDFGIAKLLDAGGAATRAGSILGTPPYMSPEQCRGLVDVDARADLYALGCILFEMLAGRPPFTDELVGDLLAAHMFRPPPVLRELVPGAPAPLDELVGRLLAKEPDARPASTDALVAALDAIRAEPGPTIVAGPAPVVAAAHRTTLSASAGERGDGRGRTRVWLGGAMVSLGAGGIVLALVLRDRGEPSAGAAAAPTDASVDAIATAEVVDAAPIDAAEPDAAVIDAAAVDAAPADARRPPADARPRPVDAGRRLDAGIRTVVTPPAIDAGTPARREIDAGLFDEP